MTLQEMDLSILLAKTTITFMILLILTRLLGKKQLSQLTFFNYVTGITIGSISANIVCNSSDPFEDDLIGLVWWCLLTGIAGFVGIKSGYIRRVIDGQPTIVIKKGKIDKAALKKARLNLDDLSMLLREQSAFSFTEVEYAILEPDGKLSIMKKQPNLQVTKADLNIPLVQVKYLPAEIIADGEIIYKNLKEYNLDQEWLNQKLQQQKINSPKEVLFAEMQSDGSLYIQRYD